MKKIRFNRPKYVIPLISLPFITLLNYVVLDTFGKPTEKEEQVVLAEKEEINIEMPSPNLEKHPVKEKFDAYLERYKFQRDFTAMQEIEPIEEDNKPGDSQYTEEERRLIDSINTAILKGEERESFMDKVNSTYQQNNRSYSPTPITAVQTQFQPKTEDGKPVDEYEKEMQMFKEQMLFIDSISRTEEQPSEVIQQPIPVAEIEKQVVPVKRNTSLNLNHFNTIKSDQDQMFIKAILDEGLKVVGGSRIRIRLMDDIIAGGYLIEKGMYLYANVTQFGQQRIQLTIDNIRLEDMILPVDLQVYDMDGQPGLYVPESEFRRISKELGANASQGTRIQMEQDPNNFNQMLFNVANQAMQTASRATGNAIRKNKAKLKYNTIIYLVSPDDKNKN